MPSLPAAILEKSLTVPKGHVLSPKEFLHLGNRAAVDQAFSRLAKAGSLQRIARGIYIACSQGEAGTVVGTEAVALSIAAKGKAAITSSGAVAAKSFGLIAQTPDEVVFLTSGRSKQLTIGATKASLQHAPYWMVALGSSLAGDAVRALAWMGAECAEGTASQLHSQLSASQWDALSSARASLPSWMAAAIGTAGFYSGLSKGSSATDQRP
ncbi:type IV toxin-antitoxin system AbiEi family antitoxin domain-containing protein [Pseudomonas gingeri]|uniref:DUF6088 family protein n=1 Tax=Pseudomonas gingeri TaxID=117681 RepID=UPI0015A4AB6F|nr:DUF6088 family protein [Pseudomonas gingeri]NVZ75183.1 type IV toxin-antitoxin system AbiEi family antitoxin domain-containing protein [Pseudomonas gingeri]